MKFNKQIAIILVLVSLLLSALGGAYYYYMLNEKSILQNNQVRVVYVASQDILKNTKIEKSHLKKMKVAKKYVFTTPLLDKEIIGKYAGENIYKNDLFRKEKIKVRLEDELNTTVVEDFKLNSYNMNFKMFQNPNYSIQKGDTINIVSVYPAVQTKFTKSPNAVQYVARQIHVLGFLSNGKESSQAINKITITKTVKKKKVTQEIEKKADEILIDIDSKVLLSLIDDYNRGNQLWMVKTHKKKKIVKKEPIAKPIVKKKTKGKKRYSKRVYKTKLYKPEPRYKKVNASIYYADDKQASVVKNKVLMINKPCNKTHHLLGVAKTIHLRSGPSYKYKIKKLLYRNYIIPFYKKS